MNQGKKTHCKYDFLPRSLLVAILNSWDWILSVLFTCSPEGAIISCGNSWKCSKKKGHKGKCGSRGHEINAFWKGSPLYATYKQRQRLVTEPRQTLKKASLSCKLKRLCPRKRKMFQSYRAKLISTYKRGKFLQGIFGKAFSDYHKSEDAIKQSLALK